MIERRIGAGVHARQRQLQRLRVVGEGARGATVNVPGKLVEQDDEAQPPARAIGPAIELAGRGALDERGELAADQLVTVAQHLGRFGAAEPELHAPLQRLRRQRHLAEPEVADLARLVHSSSIAGASRALEFAARIPSVQGCSTKLLGSPRRMPSKRFQ